MHKIAEVVIPPCFDVQAAIKQVMDYFLLEEQGVKQDHADWWDWWTIGGRFSGHKLEASLDPATLETFEALLVQREVTVSGLQAGKPALSPPSQIAMVDALWREHFPDRGEQCLLFAHARDQYRRHGYYPDDVCTVAQIPERLTCSRLIVSCQGDDGVLRPVRMLVTSLYNGLELQDTIFSGNVREGLVTMRNDEIYPVKFGYDWFCVTVDYHN